jgi:hypothetical protein
LSPGTAEHDALRYACPGDAVDAAHGAGQPAIVDLQGATRAAAIAAEITARLAAVNFALPGTIADRMTRCGHPGCRCHADPPQRHGPYHQWTRKKNGRTATRILTDDQLADYAPWFDNHRRLRELITELEELSLAIAENDPRWNR